MRNTILFSRDERCEIRVWATKEEKEGNDSKAESTKENFTVFTDILRVVLYPFKLCELDGISSQKAETKLSVMNTTIISSQWETESQKNIRHQIKSDI